MSLTVSPPSQVAHKSKSLCVSGPNGASASTAKHILKFIIIFNYANVCMQEFVHICVCAHTHKCLRSLEMLDTPKPGVTRGCDLPDADAGN